MKILVTGGTGTLGSCFEQLALGEGMDIRIASRNKPAEMKSEWCFLDVETGEGLKEALKDVDVVFHTATSPVRNSDVIDVGGTKKLLAVCKEQKIKHFIYPSIVGIDKIPMKYYESKVQVENLVQASDLPYTILRATQFHNLVEKLFDAFLRFPVTILPTKMQFQTIAVEEVAAVIVDVCKRGPQGMAEDIGGPEIMTVKEMHAIWQSFLPKRRRLVPLYLPVPVIRGFVKGYNTKSDIRRGQITWKDWLKDKA